MAERSGTSKYSVCRRCVAEDPTKYELVTEKCFNRYIHGAGVDQIDVVWSASERRLQPTPSVTHVTALQLRPLPHYLENYHGPLILCAGPPRCRDSKCTHPHSKKEKEAWEAERKTKQKKCRHSSEPDFPSDPRPPLNRSPSVPGSQQWRSSQHLESPNIGHLKVGSIPTTTHSSSPIAVALPLPPTLQPHKWRKWSKGSPTLPTGTSHPGTAQSFPDEYKQQERAREVYIDKYCKLLRIEEDQHTKILEEKCDTHSTLTLYPTGKGFPWLRHNSVSARKCFGYLDDLSDDQIAYAVQSSQDASVLYNGHKIEVELVQENFQRLDSKLYISIPSEKTPALRMHHRTTEGLKIHVEVKFNLKHTYFANLSRAMRLLPKEMINRLLPLKADFTRFLRSPILDSLDAPLMLDQCSKDQKKTLEILTSSPCNGPPILISGSFGTGKTQLLATAAQYFFKERHGQEEQTRVLVCTQQQVSADAFLEYFLQFHGDDNVRIVRLTTEYGYRRPSLNKWYMNMVEFKTKFSRKHPKPVIIITTCISALHIANGSTIPQGYFTHILLDEGAQMREPEALGALCLAGPRTKIVIAGDDNQVGPVTLVLGDEAQEYGLEKSLLRRLLNDYSAIGGLADSYRTTLVTNFRCDPAIVDLTSELFYESSLKCSEQLVIANHPSAPYPLVFVCSSIDDSSCCVENATNITEARVVLNLIKKYVTSWEEDPHEIAVISPHRSQVTQIGQMINNPKEGFPHSLRSIRRLPAYNIQGHEFRAVFISTSEPTEADGSTRNPTKSTCDRYVFNTVISRARSLVVAVGNPFLLLHMEKHMLEKYGEKGECWSTFLRVCLEKGSLSVDQSVRASPGKVRECFQKLKRLTKATKIGQEQPSAKLPIEQQAKQGVPEAQIESASNLKEAAMQDSSTKKHICKLDKDYMVKKCIGKGGFGLVFHVTHTLDDQDYAVKVIKLPESEYEQKKVRREVVALAKLVHPRIVRYFTCWKEKVSHDWRMQDMWATLRSSDTVTSMAGQSPYQTDEMLREEDEESSSPETNSPHSCVLQDSSDSIVEFKDATTCSASASSKGSQHIQIGKSIIQPRSDPPTCLFIQTELCKLDTLKDWLLKHVHDRQWLKVLHYFKQILEAVGYIHEKGMIHRDLKPSNIFFSEEEDVKVGDFGLVTTSMAADPQGLHPGSGSGSKSYGGTLFYMSPEQRDGRKCDQKTDIFALGVILFELNCPFSTESERVKILTGLRGTEFPSRFKTMFSKEASLIERMLLEKSERRPAVADIEKSISEVEMGVRKTSAGEELFMPLC